MGRVDGSAELITFLVEACDEAIWVIDLARLRFVAVNKTAAVLLGYSREELLAQSPSRIFPSLRADSQWLTECLPTPEVRDMPVTKSGQLLPRSADGYWLTEENHGPIL